MEPLFADQLAYNDFIKRHSVHHVKTADISHLMKVTVIWVLMLVLHTTKVALVDEDGNLLYSFYSSNNGSPLATTIKAIKEIYSQLPPKARDRTGMLYRLR